jgi:regulator of PEP synthase PpsR (kinase-PPPase family)
MEAINFTQAHDDGAQTRDLANAQVILIGVSRCGKTPTSLYMALQFGIRVANFPLTPDDFERGALPDTLVPFHGKLFGLTIHPERLRRIREERRPGSKYAQFASCQWEVQEAERLMAREAIPTIDTTTKSIEEIATQILHQAKLQRRLY